MKDDRLGVRSQVTEGKIEGKTIVRILKGTPTPLHIEVHTHIKPHMPILNAVNVKRNINAINV